MNQYQPPGGPPPPYPPQYQPGVMTQPPAHQSPEGAYPPSQPQWSPHQAPGMLQQAPQGMPQIHMPSAQQIQAAAQRAAELAQKASGGPGIKKTFFDIFGPNGQPFNTAPVGFTGYRVFFLAPSYQEGAPVYVERIKRFYRSKENPKGASIYAGEDSLAAKAVALAYKDGRDPNSIFLKRRRQYLWQGFAMDVDPHNFQNLYPCPQAHVDEQGVMRPMFFWASATLNDRLRQKITVLGNGDEVQGTLRVVHPHTAVPFLCSKKKTGNETRDVEYDITDLAPRPLPQEYYPGLHNLWPLDTLFQDADDQTQLKAIMDCGLPLPIEAQALMTNPLQPPQHGPQGGYQPMQPPQGYSQPYQVSGGYPLPGGQPQYIPQGMPQPPMSYQPAPMAPQGNPYGAPKPLPQVPPSGMAASVPPPPPIPQGGVPPPPPPGQGVPQSAPPVPPPAPPAGVPQQAGFATPPPQPVPTSQPPQAAPQTVTPEQLQAQFTGGKPQF